MMKFLRFTQLANYKISKIITSTRTAESWGDSLKFAFPVIMVKQVGLQSFTPNILFKVIRAD